MLMCSSVNLTFLFFMTTLGANFLIPLALFIFTFGLLFSFLISFLISFGVLIFLIFIPFLIPFLLLHLHLCPTLGALILFLISHLFKFFKVEVSVHLSGELESLWIKTSIG